MLQWIAIHLRSCYTKITVILGVTTVVFCFSFFFATDFAGAQSTSTGSGSSVTQGIDVVGEELGLPTTDIRVIIARVIRIALGLLGMVFLVLILYGGYLWMTAGGNDEQINSAKKVLLNGTVGLLIILSAYSIVLLVMRALGLGANGSVGANQAGVGIGNETQFFGSGNLGSVIKDHYPGRGEQEIPRNAKIIITFKKPVNLGSFVDNTNNSEQASGGDLLGDCNEINGSINWETDCDQLKKGDDLIIIKRKETGEQIRGAAVLSSRETAGYLTVVIRPLDIIGSETADEDYTVRIGNGVQLDDAANGNPSIFAGRPAGRDFYEWEFTTNSSLDITPPFVTSVFPAPNSTESKNSVIQIDFNEPIDPTGIQGAFKTENDYYVLDGNSVYLKSVNSVLPTGEFRLTNGYRTLEFTPANECGENACGGKIYCLPVCDKDNASCTSDRYDMLLRAGQTFNTSTFEALPFSGIMDMTGNALDANRNKVVDKVSTAGAVFPDQLQPDNYFWNFTIENKIDLTAPFLKQVTPGPDATNITENQEVSLLFTKRMRADSMYAITIEQQPAAGESVCVVPRLTFNDDGTTKTELKHCPFVADTRHYYYPVVDSNVQDVKFNCFYPGKGPITTELTTKASGVCDEANPQNCCKVDRATGQAFCCNGLTNLADTAACIEELRKSSPL